MLLGCSSGDRRYSVQGKVKFDGQPVTLGSIVFIPEDGKKRAAHGEIKDGSYNMAAKDGPIAGKHRVQIQWNKFTGKETVNSDTGEKVKETEQVLPEKYNEKSTLTATIPAPSGKLDFDLTK